MPWGDRTGPNGAGPMTGRGMGYCAGYSTPGYTNPVLGRNFARGFGGGFGRGRGFRWRYYATGVPGWAVPAYPAARVPYTAANAPVAPQQTADAKQQEIAALEQESKALEQELETVKKRLAELRK